MLRLLKDLDEAKETLSHVEAQRGELENQVHLLRPKNLDKDMLDEQVRRQLGFVAGDEIVVIPNAPPEVESAGAAPVDADVETTP